MFTELLYPMHRVTSGTLSLRATEVKSAKRGVSRRRRRGRVAAVAKGRETRSRRRQDAERFRHPVKPYRKYGLNPWRPQKGCERQIGYRPLPRPSRPMKQIAFADAEFSAKKRVTRRERCLAEMELVAPWAALLAPGYLRWVGGTARAPTDRPGADAAHGPSAAVVRALRRWVGGCDLRLAGPTWLPLASIWGGRRCPMPPHC